MSPSIRVSRRLALAVGAAAVSFLAAADALRAANGLANPDFDSSVTGWAAVDGALAWNGGLDVNSCAGSGVAVGSNPVLVAGKWTVSVKSSGSCVPVAPGGNVRLRARVLFETTVSNTDFALLGYSDGSCSAGEVEIPIAGYGALPLIWLDFQLGIAVDGATSSVRFLMRTSAPAVSSYSWSLVRVYPGVVSYVVAATVNGRRCWRTIARTDAMPLAVARDRAREVLVAAKAGRDLTVDHHPRGQPTFGAVWRQMIDEVDKGKLSPATIDDYEDRARRLILPKIGAKRIGDVTQADVDKLVSATTGQRSRAYVVVLVKKTINFAKRARLLPDEARNPAAGIVVKKSSVKVARALEIEEIAAFRDALAAMESEGSVSPWLAGLLRLSLVCALRPGEVRTLKWADVNRARREMTVVGKTGARKIYLTDAALEILDATPVVGGCEYVFAGRRHGQPLIGIHKGLSAVQTRAGIERFRPYDLRHSAATGALAAGADVRAVQAMLGHADLKTTSGYLHSSDKRRDAAAEKAAAFATAGRPSLGEAERKPENVLPETPETLGRKFEIHGYIETELVPRIVPWIRKRYILEGRPLPAYKKLYEEIARDFAKAKLLQVSLRQVERAIRELQEAGELSPRKRRRSKRLGGLLAV